jgi:hypothetical protein
MLAELGASLLARQELPEDPDRAYGFGNAVKMRRSEF